MGDAGRRGFHDPARFAAAFFGAGIGTTGPFFAAGIALAAAARAAGLAWLGFAFGFVFAGIVFVAIGFVSVGSIDRPGRPGMVGSSHRSASVGTGSGDISHR
jgi:hypothetical protein